MRRSSSARGMYGNRSRLPGLGSNSVHETHRTESRSGRAGQNIQAYPVTRIEWGRAESRAHLIRRLAGHLADEIIAGRLSHREARKVIRERGW